MAAEHTIRLSTAEAATGTVRTLRLERRGRVEVRIPPVKDGQLLQLPASMGEARIRVLVMQAWAIRVLAVLPVALGSVIGAGLALFGSLLIVAGQDGLHSTAAPTCQGQAMQPGEFCDVTSSLGSSGTFSYRKMAAQAHESSHQVFVLGIVVTVIAALVLALVIWAALRKWPPLHYKHS